MLQVKFELFQTKTTFLRFKISIFYSFLIAINIKNKK